MPEIGEKAPDFNALDNNQQRFILSSQVKKGKVLLAFYPADNTPVCTAQLCDYRDHLEDFKGLNVQVVGISISTHEKQSEFAKKQEFNFPLLNDYDSRITHKYDVMSFTGHPKRAVFLIDENQKIIFKHVEFLAITRRTSDELLEKIKSFLPKEEKAQKTESSVASDASNKEENTQAAH
ncbi:MAG: peroxiredoxin [Deltaproteobacteria bacterium]|nr:peroxiredoxin [Deltaproteobacteria bacterium]